MLNQSNIGNNNNKFYEMQIIKAGAGFILFTHWGRVSYKGQKKEEKFTSIKPCIAKYEKTFYSKTGNNWNNRDSFVEKNRKYTLVDVVFDSDEESESSEEETEKNKKSKKKGSKLIEIPESKLDKRLQKFISMIFDIKIMTKTLASLNIDQKKAPLGKLSKKQLRDGYAALKLIEDIIKTGRGNLESACNKFYSKIPHNFGFSRPPLIRTTSALNEKIELLDTLNQIGIAGEMIKKQQKQKEYVNQIDTYYKDLNCKLTPLDHDSDEFKMIVKFVNKTHGSTHFWYTLVVEEVFAAEKTEEIERYKKYEKADDRWLLWHGSRKSNAVGIISQGLRIAPPNAPVTGYMFGKGVYFANSVSKSANYCRTSKFDNVGVMYLDEVYLGNRWKKQQAHYVTKLPNNFHSTWGQGKITPDESTHEDFLGMKVPIGNMINAGLNTVLRYDEFIVYDIAQIRTRFIIQMRFDYKN
ncbi:poly (adp-ribose) polymerase [Anaeramoeba flamelloides]|uniref:Poly [ADP-ribose] polymerase n=1 Tax=Anaeramoeba flamelloides TaxID=1746091 RepID=A0AAV7YY68_9EUKA|nr:poly (adp-ribose) polymerase [Anaeramoeba flamelloides]